MNVRSRVSADKVAEAAIDGMERNRHEVLPGSSSILRLMGRLRPRAVLQGKMGERMSAEG